jgi:hypothetical protein
MLNLKDGLKDIITVGLQTYKSINEVLIANYERYKVKGEGFGFATYRGKILVLDIEDCDEDISPYEYVLRQVQEIDFMIEDGE